MKKIIRLFLTVSVLLMSVSGCTDTDKSQTDTNIQVVTTIFPLYDWCQVLSKGSEKINVTKLVSTSSDMHSYQPTAQDIVKISTCDVFIYVGGESDEWASEALKQAVNKDMIVIDLMDVLKEKLVPEESKQGMETEEEEEEAENDEHVWLSLRNAMIVCEKISETLTLVDSDNKDIYQKNLDAYINNLEDLDRRYQGIIEKSDKKTLLFADRFPFRYLCEDYGLDYYAAFKGCSAESEASFETIRFLSEKADELKLKAVLCIEGSDGKIAKTVVENTSGKDQQILTINSLQSHLDQSDTYLSVMENNLNVLEQALS